MIRGSGSLIRCCGHNFISTKSGSLSKLPSSFLGKFVNENIEIFSGSMASHYVFKPQIKSNMLYGWGRNTEGQLDSSGEDFIKESKLVHQSDHSVEFASCGPFHTLIYNSDGTIKGLGNNRFGELGSDALTRETEFKIKDINNHTVTLRQLIAGCDFSIALSNNGTVYSWGRNEEGQLCKDSNIRNSSEYSSISNLPKSIKSIAVGWGHTLAISEDGRLYSWGSNMHGQLGTGDKKTKFEPNEVLLPEPYLWKSQHPTSSRFIQVNPLQIYCGGCYSMMLCEIFSPKNETSTKKLFIWGSYKDGKLGLGDISEDIVVPTILPIENPIDANCGCDHAIAIDIKNRIWGWGFGQHYGLGWQYNFEDFYDTPRLILSEDRNLDNKILQYPLCTQDDTLLLLQE